MAKSRLFLTFGSGTSGAWNKKLRPLFNVNIPPISGKYGLRNHFLPLESGFLMRLKVRKGALTKKKRLIISMNAFTEHTHRSISHPIGIFCFFSLLDHCATRWRHCNPTTLFPWGLVHIWDLLWDCHPMVFPCHGFKDFNVEMLSSLLSANSD